MNKKKEIQYKQQLMLLKQQKNYAEAKALAEKLAKQLPKDIEVRYALAQLQAETGEMKAAVQSFARVYSKSSPFRITSMEQALDICVTERLNKLGESTAKNLLSLKPKSAEAHFKCGLCLFDAHKNLEALDYFKTALEIEPNLQKHIIQYGLTLNLVGQSKNALEFFKKAQSLEPDDKYASYFFLWCQNYIENQCDKSIAKCHRQYGERLEAKYPEIQPFESTSAENGRIKIGFLSQDFFNHSVAYFFMPIIKNYSKDNWEVFCYSDVEKPDEITACIKNASEHWRDCRKMSDKALYDQIRGDKIDILVDLVGILGEGRLEMLAMKAAPVQINYLGYPNTLGLKRVDYRLSDHWADPPCMTEHFHTEKLVRLNAGFLCFEANKHAPDVSELPATRKGYITFGSFNIFQKISDANLKLWADILASVPNSKLLIKSRPLAEIKLQEQVRDKFAKLGIESNRLDFVGWIKEKNTHLSIYSEIDIHLDTFPYNGTTTTCEAMWQGVPTICLAGANHRSRVGVSILSQLNLHSWIADTEKEYVEIAIKASQDLKGLAEMRSSLRHTMKESLLMNSHTFIRELEDLFNTMTD